MGAFIAKQPNGLYCRYSSIVDNITHHNMTEEEYIELCAEGYAYIVYNIHCRDNRVVNTNAGYATYEFALEDALKYALDNLV